MFSKYIKFVKSLKQIPSPSNVVAALWKHIEFRFKITFFTTLAAGLLAHLYMFVNKLPNYDDVRTLDGFGGSGGSGRWGLAQIGNVVTDLGLMFSLPLFNGLMSIVILAVAACFVVKIFHTRDSILCGLIGCMLIVFPAWTCTFFFMFTSVFYSIAILITVLSVYFTVRYKHGWIAGVIFLTGSLSIYQAYFPLAAALMLIRLIMMCFDENENLKKVVSAAIKSVVCLLMTFILYIMLTEFYCWFTGQALYDYQNINELGFSNLGSLLNVGLLSDVYAKFFSIFADNTLEMSYYPAVRLMNCIMAVVLLIQSFCLFLKIKKNIPKVVLGIIFYLLFPLAMLGIYIMVREEEIVYSILLYPVVSIYIFEIVLCEKFYSSIMKDISLWIISICGGITVFFFIHYANAQYLSMDFTLRQAESYYTTMVSTIKNMEGYHDELEVIFIGETITDASFYQNERMSDFDTTGRERTFLNLYCRDYFMREYCGFQVVVDEFRKKEPAIIYQKEAETMNCYPDDGSMMILGDKLLIRLE